MNEQPTDERMRKIAAGQLGEQLGVIVSRIEATSDDLAKLDRDQDAITLSPEGRHIFERSGAEEITRPAQNARSRTHGGSRARRPPPQHITAGWGLDAVG